MEGVGGGVACGLRCRGIFAILKIVSAATNPRTRRAAISSAGGVPGLLSAWSSLARRARRAHLNKTDMRGFFRTRPRIFVRRARIIAGPQKGFGTVDRDGCGCGFGNEVAPAIGKKIGNFGGLEFAYFTWVAIVCVFGHQQGRKFTSIPRCKVEKPGKTT